MAKGDDVHKITEITIRPGEQVRIEYEVGIEGAAGKFVKSGAGIKTLDWPDFIDKMGAIPKAGLKAMWDKSRVILSQEQNLSLPLSGDDRTLDVGP